MRTSCWGIWCCGLLETNGANEGGVQQKDKRTTKRKWQRRTVELMLLDIWETNSRWNPTLCLLAMQQGMRLETHWSWLIPEQIHLATRARCLSTDGPRRSPSTSTEQSQQSPESNSTRTVHRFSLGFFGSWCYRPGCSGEHHAELSPILALTAAHSAVSSLKATRPIPSCSQWARGTYWIQYHA